MESAGKARNNGLYRHIRTSKEIIRNLLNDSAKHNNSEAVMELYKRCQPTIKKYSYVNGKFDEDLYQNLVIAFLGVIEKFK